MMDLERSAQSDGAASSDRQRAVRRRRIRRLWLAGYLLAGVVYCVACDSVRWGGRWAELALGRIPEPRAMKVQRIDRMRATRGAEGTVEIELGLTSPSGESFELSGSGRSNDGSIEPWSTVRVALGASEFAVGSAVHVVDDDGTVAHESTTLTSTERRDGLLVFLHEGREDQWFAFVYPPVRPVRSDDVDLVVGDAVRIPLPSPITESSRRKRALAAVFMRPTAAVVDVVTWPVQLVMLGIAMTRVPVH